MKKGKPILTGVDEVLRNLNDAIQKIEGASQKGIIKAGIIVIRDMEKTSPKIPVDTGNLRSSRFMTTAQMEIPVPGNKKTFRGEKADKMQQEHGKTLSSAKRELSATKKPMLMLGFSANYALWVHEKVDARFYRPEAPKGKKGRPGSGAKFLEMALLRNQKLILETIAKEATIKK